MNTWTIVKITERGSGNAAPMFAAVNSDGHAYILGELAETLDLLRAIREFAEAGGRAKDEIDALDSAFGHRWISTSDAAREFDVPASTMRAWMAQSGRAEKRGREWYAPLLVVRGWVARRGGPTPVVSDAASPPASGEQTRASGQAGEGSAPHPPRA